jgi:hypothetical protein
MSIPRRGIDWKHYERCQAEGMIGQDYALRIGEAPNNFAQKKRRHYRDHPRGAADVPTDGDADLALSNGDETAGVLAIPSAHPVAPQRTSALPAHYDASELDHLRGRVATFEAFMAAIKSQQRPSACQRTDRAPAHQDASEPIYEALVRLDTRLSALEASAFIPRPLSTLSAHSDAPAHRLAPECMEPPRWLNRGTHIATDMVEWIDTYARQYRMEKREVVDLALRTLHALVAGEGASDA